MACREKVARNKAVTLQSTPTDLKGVAAKNGVGLIFAKTVQYKLRVKVIKKLPATFLKALQLFFSTDLSS